MLTSRQWFGRVAMVLAFGASEVVVAAIAGVAGWRLLVIALLACAFTLSYLVTPSAGKPEYEPHALRPVEIMTATTTIAVAITGGLASPMLPLLACPYVMAFTMFRPRRLDLVLGAIPIAAITVLWLACDVHLVPENALLLGAWTFGLALWVAVRRVAQLFEKLRAMNGCLSRVREGALSDAASRRRGLESMTAKLAHELKNPLAAIKSLAQVELQNASDERARRRLDVVLAETERIGTILREYLDLARPVEALHVTAFPLEDLMSEVATLLEGRAGAAGVALAVAGAGGPIHADRRLLKEALVNTVCNALEATPRGGSVMVRYRRQGGAAHIEIRDTGKGMTAEVARRVGTPYFTTRPDGTGLGVAIARAAIAQHRGQLSYAGAAGGGTIATIVLPAEPPRAAGEVAA